MKKYHIDLETVLFIGLILLVIVSIVSLALLMTHPSSEIYKNIFGISLVLVGALGLSLGIPYCTNIKENEETEEDYDEQKIVDQALEKAFILLATYLCGPLIILAGIIFICF